jgi:hypothetical protein
LIDSLMHSGILKPIKPGSWMLNYPEFRTVSTKTETSAKPVGPTAGAKQNAAGIAPPALQGAATTASAGPRSAPASQNGKLTEHRDSDILRVLKNEHRI